MVESPTTGYDCSINHITPHVCSDTTHSIEGSCGHRPVSLPRPPPFRLAASVSWCWSGERRGEQLKWSLAFRLYIGSFPCAQLPGPVHTARLCRVFFCVFSLGLCLVCSFVLFDLFICPHSFMFPWAVDSSPLSRGYN